jgi:Mannosyltransferase (PIG-V)
VTTTEHSTLSVEPAAPGPRAPPSARRRLGAVLGSWPVQDVLLPFGVTRLLLVLVGWFAQYVMPAAPDGDPWRPSAHALINAWAGWDSRWYVQIAQQGYSLEPTPDGQVSVAFWPALPLLMRLGGLLVRRTDAETLAVVGIAVSNVALLVAVFYLVRLARDDFDERTGSRAGLYLLIWPATLFLSAVYPHALFLAFAIASFSYARHGAWWRAGLLGGAAALTRTVGVLLVFPLAWEFLRQRRLRAGVPTGGSAPPVGRSSPQRLIALLLVPLGLLAWMAYLALHFGKPLAFLDAQRAWNRAPAAPWHILDPYLNGYNSLYGYSSTYLDLAFTVLYGVLVVASWRTLPRSYALFATLLLLVPLSTGSTQSIMRLGLELFPIFLVLALAGRHRWFDQSYLVLSTGLATVFAVLFALHYWVA